MNLFVCIVASVGLLGMCTHSNVVGQAADYQNVVEVPMDGISRSEAKRMAYQRAAEITVQRGDQYFTVYSEQVTREYSSGQGSQPFGGNKYQELIIQNNFSRDRLQNEGTPSTQTVYRLVFTSHKERSGLQSIDACKYTDCN